MSKRVNLSLKDSQYNTWKQMAEEREMTLPEFIRTGVRVYVMMLQKRAEKEQKGGK